MILYRLGWHGHRIGPRLRDDLSVLYDRCYNLALRVIDMPVPSRRKQFHTKLTLGCDDGDRNVGLTSH